jgi:NAD(P)-dependent dehydrogenase (short-subunit alcohol dehydrogenase family)
MAEQGWGRIVNVTTKLDTMNRPHTSPYGASKAALEMATEVWAKEVEGAAKAAPRASSSPTRWRRRSSMSSRARPTASTAGASTPTSGTRHSRPPKPPAPPASKCSRNRVNQSALKRGTGKRTMLVWTG